MRNLYYNPKTGFTSLQQLIKLVKQRYPNTPSNIIKEWYDKQIPVQTIQQPNRRIEYHKIIGDGTSYQGDIMFLENKRNNDGYIGMLTFINNSTRFAYAYPIKTNKTGEIIANLRKFLGQVPKEITNITTDNEFYNNREITNLFEENGIEHFVEDPNVHSKLSIINRFHRTLRGLLNKYFLAYNTDRWIDIIDDIIYNYNNRYHRTLGKSPNEMTEDDVNDLNEILNDETTKSLEKFRKFKIGDIVRHIDGRQRFAKGPRKYSQNIFIIESIDGLSFSLKNISTGKPAPRTYRYHELKKVELPSQPPEQQYQIPKKQTDKEKTMRKRRIREMINLDVPIDEYGHPIDEIILEPRKRQRRTTDIIID